MIDAELAALDFCYLTTTGRTTGETHRIEIWFAAHPRETRSTCSRVVAIGPIGCATSLRRRTARSRSATGDWWATDA